MANTHADKTAAEAMALADSYIEAGLSLPEFKRLGRLAHLSGVTVEDLIEAAQSDSVARTFANLAEVNVSALKAAAKVAR